MGFHKILATFLIAIFFLAGCTTGDSIKSVVNHMKTDECLKSHHPNITPCYKELWRSNEDLILNLSDLAELRSKYKILFVRGYLSDAVVNAYGKYFDDQMNWLAESSVDIDYIVANKENSGFDSEFFPKRNADHLNKLIESDSSGKRFLIISHSKGGLDVLETLVKYPGLIQNKIAGWIPMQAPFWGTPVANWLTTDDSESKDIRKLTEEGIGFVMEQLLEGDKPVLATMRLDVRREVMSQLASASVISNLTETIPVIAFGSWKDPTFWFFTDTWMVSRDLMKNENGDLLENDGLVPVDSALLESEKESSSRFIKVEGVDHALPVMNSSYDFFFDRAKFTEILIKLWLERSRTF